jgi:hypothetical protein
VPADKQHAACMHSLLQEIDLLYDGHSQMNDDATHAWYDFNAAQPMQLLYA